MSGTIDQKDIDNKIRRGELPVSMGSEGLRLGVALYRIKKLEANLSDEQQTVSTLRARLAAAEKALKDAEQFLGRRLAGGYFGNMSAPEAEGYTLANIRAALTKIGGRA